VELGCEVTLYFGCQVRAGFRLVGERMPEGFFYAGTCRIISEPNCGNEQEEHTSEVEGKVEDGFV